MHARPDDTEGMPDPLGYLVDLDESAYAESAYEGTTATKMVTRDTRNTTKAGDTKHAAPRAALDLRVSMASHLAREVTVD